MPTRPKRRHRQPPPVPVLACVLAIRGLSHKEAAALAGLNHETVSHIIRGRRVATPAQRATLAKTFEIAEPTLFASNVEFDHVERPAVAAVS